MSGTSVQSELDMARSFLVCALIHDMMESLLLGSGRSLARLTPSWIASLAPALTQLSEVLHGMMNASLNILAVIVIGCKLGRGGVARSWGGSG
jgi:type IV secretory pathway VirB2 component (pilin)